jgi:hypothetical protein
MLLDTSGLLCYHHRDERQHRGITEALTTDHHFEQERFVRLLEP